MKRIDKSLIVGALLAGALFVAPVQAQVSPSRRDSTVADSLTRLRPWLNGWRSQTLEKAITTLRVPHPASRVDTVRVVRVDTLTRVDTVFAQKDSVIKPPPDTVVVKDTVTPPPPPPVNVAPVAVIARVTCDSVRRCVAVDASTDDKAVTARAWAWGDGSTSTALTPSHTYAAYGSYTLRLIVRDLEGLADTATAPVTLSAPVANAGPTASFSKSYDPTTRTVAVNAGASKDDKAITEYKWAWGDGGSSLGVTATHRYIASGTFAISLTVRDAEGLSATTSQTQPVAVPDTVVQSDSGNAPPPDTGSIATRAELPRSTPNPVFAQATRTVSVTPLMDLQAAFNAAQPGDSLVLAAGATWTGNFVLPTRSCGAGITVTTGVALPLGRMTPSKAATLKLAKIVSPNSVAALATTNPTCGWRLAGLEIVAGLAGAQENYGAVWLGDGGAPWETQQSMAQVPNDFLLDRLYIHGGPTLSLRRCLYINSGRTIVRDSWLSDCHSNGGDSQAILGCNGPGPYLIENNYLEGGHENILFGGCDPKAPEMTPSDITIRRNHVAKPLAWRTMTPKWTVKNLFELKNAARVLVEENIFENSWPDGQEGMAIVIKTATYGSCCTWEGTTDLTFRYNIVRNAAVGLNLQAIDLSPGQANTNRHVARVTVYENLFDQIGAEGRSALMLLTHDLADISIQRNQFKHVGTRGAAIVFDYSDGLAKRLDISENVMTAGNPENGVVVYTGAYGAGALTKAAGSSWKFSGNQIVGGAENAGYFTGGAAVQWLTQWPSVVSPAVARTAGVVVP